MSGPFGLPSLMALGDDLRHTSIARRVVTLTRPFLFASGYGWTLSTHRWLFAAACLAALFLSVVASAHDLVHQTLGLPAWLNDVLLALIGMLVLESGHAYRATHLQHHRRFPRDDDPEGRPAHGSYIAALLAGPLFLFRLYMWAFRRRPSWWLVVEGVWFVLALSVAVAAWPVSSVPALYVMGMIVASWSYPLMTVRLVHDPTAENPLNQTRTLRGTLMPKMFLELSYHLEHHLYPAVPSHNYRELSRRLEPLLIARGVAPITLRTVVNRRGSPSSRVGERWIPGVNER